MSVAPSHSVRRLIRGKIASADLAADARERDAKRVAGDMASSALAAGFVASDPADEQARTGALVIWCAHCEDLHFHAAGERGDARRVEAHRAQCDDESGSPHIGRHYALKVVEGVANVRDMLPSTPMQEAARAGERSAGSSPRLWRQLQTAGRRIRASIVAAMLDRKSAHGEVVAAEFRKSCALIFDAGDDWSIARAGSVEQGNGVLSLAEALFGVPRPIAARRIFETATGSSLPPAIALQFEGLMSAWLSGTQPQEKTS